jgi:hypothetical protein
MREAVLVAGAASEHARRKERRGRLESRRGNNISLTEDTRVSRVARTQAGGAPLAGGHEGEAARRRAIVQQQHRGIFSADSSPVTHRTDDTMIRRLAARSPAVNEEAADGKVTDRGKIRFLSRATETRIKHGGFALVYKALGCCSGANGLRR